MQDWAEGKSSCDADPTQPGRTPSWTMNLEWLFKVIPRWTEMAWLSSSVSLWMWAAQGRGWPWARRLSAAEKSLKADSQKLSVNSTLSSCGKSYTEEGSWPCILWAVWLSAILESHSHFRLRKRKSFLEFQQIPGKDSGLPWIIWLHLGPIIWPGSE